jgi:glycosyltransferase involved in cell wall biosynthesis
MVSIIMPVKNGVPFIEECIQSVQGQIYRNWQLVVVDDHSEDQTKAVVRSITKSDSRVMLFNNQGSGIIAALQTGYYQARGNYITRMDADDIMAPDKLDKLRQLLLGTSKPTVAVAKVKYFSSGRLGNGYRQYQDWLNLQIDQKNQFKEIYKECVIPSPCWMTTRATLDLCNAFDSELYPEDYDLCFRFYEHSLKVEGSNEVLHYWRDHPGRASRISEDYADNSFLNLKLNYFLKLDHNPGVPLILWGAGKKGKTLARLLTERGIGFVWGTNNPNKIGHAIRGVLLQDIDIIMSRHKLCQVLIAVASPQEQKDIRDQLKLKPKLSDYWFC